MMLALTLLGVVVYVLLVIKLAHWFFNRPDKRTRMAEKRWAKNNKTQPRICMCGKPGTVVRYHHGNVGRVPVEFWYCEDHAHIPLETPWCDGEPMVQRSDGVWTQSVDSLVKRGLVTVVREDDTDE